MKYGKLIIVGLALLSLSACVDLPKTGTLDRTNYMLSVAAPTAPAHPIDAIVMIDNASIAPQYASSYFTYQTGASTYSTDYYHRFFINPSLIISQIMQNWLSPYFTQVIPNTSMILPDYVIQPNITELYADLQSTQAVMSINVMLLRRASMQVNLQTQKTFTASHAFTLNNPQSLINAWNQDLQQIFTQMTAMLTAQIK